MSQLDCEKCGKKKKKASNAGQVVGVSDNEKWRYVQQAHQLSSGFITVLDNSQQWDIAIRMRQNAPRLVIRKEVNDDELARLLMLRVCDSSDKRTALPKDAWRKVQELNVCLAEWTAAELPQFVNGFGVFESVLQKLDISGCVKVESLPKLSMFQNLKELNVCKTGIETLCGNFDAGYNGQALERICFTLVEGKRNLSDYLPTNVKPKKLEIYYSDMPAADEKEVTTVKPAADEKEVTTVKPAAEEKEVTTVNLSGLSALSGLVSLRFVNNTTDAVELACQVWQDIEKALSKNFEDLFLVGVQLNQDKIQCLQRFSQRLVYYGRTRGFNTLHLEGCTWEKQQGEVGYDADYKTADNVDSEVAACLGSKMNASILEFVECAFIGNELAEKMWSRGSNPRINNFEMWSCWNTNKMFPPCYGHPPRHKMPSLQKLALDPCPLDDDKFVASIEACKSLQSLKVDSVKAELYEKLKGLVIGASVKSLALYIDADFDLVSSLVQDCSSLRTLKLSYPTTTFTLAQWYEVLKKAESLGCQMVFTLPTNVRPYKP